MMGMLLRIGRKRKESILVFRLHRARSLVCVWFEPFPDRRSLQRFVNVATKDFSLSTATTHLPCFIYLFQRVVVLPNMDDLVLPMLFPEENLERPNGTEVKPDFAQTDDTPPVPPQQFLAQKPTQDATAQEKSEKGNETASNSSRGNTPSWGCNFIAFLTFFSSPFISSTPPPLCLDM